MPPAQRTQLDHVLLGSFPGPNGSWAMRTSLTYDIRTDKFGDSDYSVSVNIDRIGSGTVGWIVHRDGSFGAVAGIIVFDGGAEDPDGSGICYANGRLWPLPHEYWIDGARLQLLGWAGAPFKTGPSRFQNGTTVKPGNLDLLMKQVVQPVKEWLLAEVAAARNDESDSSMPSHTEAPAIQLPD